MHAKTWLCVDTPQTWLIVVLTYRNDCGSSKLELCCEYCVYVRFFVQLVMGVNRILYLIIINQTIVTQFFWTYVCLNIWYLIALLWKFHLHKHIYTNTHSFLYTHNQSHNWCKHTLLVNKDAIGIWPYSDTSFGSCSEHICKWNYYNWPLAPPQMLSISSSQLLIFPRKFFDMDHITTVWTSYVSLSSWFT